MGYFIETTHFKTLPDEIALREVGYLSAYREEGVPIVDYRYVPEERVTELKSLVLSLYVCATGGDCDDCPVNDATAISGTNLLCDGLKERMKELGIEES